MTDFYKVWYEYCYWMINQYFFSLFLKKKRCRSQRPSGLRPGSTAASLLGLRVRIPLEAWMSVSCECCLLLSRGHATGRSLVQRSPTDCDVLLCVIYKPRYSEVEGTLVTFYSCHMMYGKLKTKANCFFTCHEDRQWCRGTPPLIPNLSITWR